MIYNTYGPPDVLQLQELEKTVPKDHEVLIKVHASSVTTADTMMRRGDTFLSRVILGLTRPATKYRILGTELSGIVESVGSKVSRFKPGDQVYGFRGFGTGVYAEYKCMGEKASLAMKPYNVSHKEAVALVDGATTALFFLKQKGGIRSGDKVLINGASGSIGTYAVQLAKYYGAEVTGVCSAINMELVKALGADHVVDYTCEDFTQHEGRYDIIFDTVGKSTFMRCKRALKPRGRYLVTVAGFVPLLQTLWTRLSGGKRAILAMSVNKNRELEIIRGLVEEEKIKAIIDREYPLEDLTEAHRYVETGRKRGNVVVKI